MAFSKVTLNGTTLMDVTQDTVDEESLVRGETATKANGVRTTGTLDLPIGIGEPYAGVDLTEKYASEIATFGGDPWAWIKNRISNNNFDGLHIGDYIPFACTNQAGTTLNARIIGINTYKNYGDTAVGNHIDFFAGLWPTRKPINTVNYNNGTSQDSHPWLASDIYLYANSLQGQAPSTSGANPSLAAKDYRNDGIYYYLPSALKSVIVEKRAVIETRYDSSSLLLEPTTWSWVNMGKIWFPSEIEVFGTSHWAKSGYASGGFVPYPFFQQNMNRIINGRSGWWTSTPPSGYSTQWCYITYLGLAHYTNTSYASASAPVCFRIA